MSKKQVYYNIDEIDKLGCTYNLIYGEKSNGKSYQIKLKKMLKKYIETGSRFILMRRWEADLKNNWVEDYFTNMDILSLTDNKYNTILKKTNHIHFGNLIINEDGSITKKWGEHIGYAIPISLEQHYSSADFTDCNDIIVEEFMERGSYIPNVVAKFSAFYSTVDRKRGTTRVWLIGNTITRSNPYIYEWGLQPIVRKMKQGDIKKVELPNMDGEPITLAIEYCRSSGGKSMIIGNAGRMIDSGSWQSFPQPHLPKSKKEYNIVLRIGFQYKGFSFVGELLQDKEDYTQIPWFIYPNVKEFKNMLVFSDIIKPDRMYQRDIYNISINNKSLQNVLNTFREGNIFYSDDLTGTDFKQVIDFTIRR